VRARREDVDWTRREDDLRGSVDDSGRRAANAISVVVMGQCAENCGLIGERRDQIFAPFFWRCGCGNGLRNATRFKVRLILPQQEQL
jgi:hypothetical protein